MIKFINPTNSKPLQIFKAKYDEALHAKQPNIEAMTISSFNKTLNEVDSRYVNLKFIMNEEFIFFSNYNSPKALSFKSHNQIAVVFYWSSINAQIRMKAKIKKTSNDYNQKYFFERSREKNALAISSNQSKPIETYENVRENYDKTLVNENLEKCPDYWGGFSFIPYYFEFWEGHKSRINKREIFNKIDGYWKQSFLQP